MAQSYSSKSTALRGAKRAGMENAVAYESEGRWYISDASEVLGKADDFEATPDELAAQTLRPRTELYRGYTLNFLNDAWNISHPGIDGFAHEGIPTLEEARAQVDHDEDYTPPAKPEMTTEEATAPAAPEKMKSYKQVANYNKSSKESPVAYIHAFLSANPTLSRKAAVIALTSEHGINYSTARTQYQRWFSANKAAK
ncbi:hypothetical protein EVC17_054 [Rhizobium phage RHph_Y1_1]|nr:hypothetical protein EVB80_054 [Rhizobium phage RHph_I36]QIG75411.1 hypothetical protein EVC17_054 [Rhizobium phage RHph_Y1_1]QIG75961.1 hypothetical protein EVC21_054 [Rhizobium phage RHph_Y2_17_2]